ncbi:glutaredoxin family protein [Aerococcus kribbianus]|uniref:Glutaredoxin family protein n=1 Tax=Aerococcus kribbianus TaxID=2999064 RepID=A0A9X3JFN0_9LACT|nr:MULTISPECIES: glutaredoxin family protein [unclassified Aerococcus]MCZ0717844.1 glutaredoxin family protein [Aerococcus sp. YH-aer221]MCZ0726131.1 glutaredoxin family protein [Aerococcus sp. YH-aer222]
MITVYSKPNCSQCTFTKRMLQDNKIEFAVKDITKSDEALQEARMTGFTSMPIVVTDKETFCGFKPDKIMELRNEKER